MLGPNISGLVVIVPTLGAVLVTGTSTVRPPRIGWSVTRLSVVKFSLRYHDFNADTGGSNYGTEFDFQTLYTASWGQLFGFKGAFYSADSFAADTDKLWLWMQYRF